MANEFVARRGIIAQSGGAKITGSLLVSGAIDATGYNIIASSFTGSFSGSIGTATTASYVSPSGLPAGTVSASSQIDYNAIQNKLSGVISSSAQFNALSGTSASYALTASFASNANIPAGTVSSSTQFNTLTDPFTGSFTGSFTGDGSGLTGIATVLNVTGSTGTSTINLKTQALTINGGNGITTNATGQSVTVSAPAGTVSASSQIDYNSIQNKLSGVVSSSAQVAPLLPAGTVSSSGQVVVQNTTGIGALATTGSNTFQGSQTITGSLFISQNLTVLGSSSISYVSQSTLNIGTNLITVNAQNPSVRFGGLAVIDSGSSPQVSGSLLFDSVKNEWIFVHQGLAPTSSVFLVGPETYNDLGNEIYLTQNRLPKSQGDEHLVDSQISDNGITVSITNGLSVGTNLTASQADITTLRATSISASVSGALTGTFPYNSLTSIPSGIVSSSAQVTTLLPTNTVSSSAQVQVFLPGGTVSSSAQYPGWVTASSQIQLASITGTTFAASNFTFPQQLTVSGVLSGSTSAFINNTLYSGSAVTGIVGPVSNQVVASIAAASCDGVFFDYVIKDGTNYRTGTVMVVSNGTTVEFTDTSTNDIGNTAEAVFTVDISGGLIRLKFTNSSGTWTVKTAIRAL